MITKQIKVMRIILLMVFVILSIKGNSQINFSIKDELKEWEISLTGNPNSTNLITLYKKKNIIDYTDRNDSLYLFYSEDSRLIKLKLTQGRYTQKIYHLNKNGLILKKSTFKRNRNEEFDMENPHEEFQNRYMVNRIHQELTDRFGFHEILYKMDSNGNIIEEWEEYKDSLYLKNEFTFDSNNRFLKRTKYFKFLRKFNESTRKFGERYIVKFDKPSISNIHRYTNVLDTTIIEIFSSKEIQNSNKKWRDGMTEYELNTKYNSYNVSYIGKTEKKPASLHGIAKEVLIETNKDSIITLIKSYASLEDFHLDRTIKYIMRSDGTGFIYSADNTSLDCNNEDLKRILVTEKINRNQHNQIEEHIIKHNGEVIYNMKIEQIR